MLQTTINTQSGFFNGACYPGSNPTMPFFPQSIATWFFEQG
jgi:hypothetical protein